MRVAIERLLALRGWSLTLLCGAVLAAAMCLAFSLAAVSVFRRWSRLSPASPYRPGNRGGAVAKCLLWLTGRRCRRCLPGLPIAGYILALFH